MIHQRLNQLDEVIAKYKRDSSASRMAATLRSVLEGICFSQALLVTCVFLLTFGSVHSGGEC
jgi:hypothetical protein